MPLSRLDLPGIVDAIQTLYRMIENPPSDDWQAPAWVVEHYKRFTNAKIPFKDGEKPSHAWLIRVASDALLDKLAPHRRGEDCPEITESPLDRRDKIKLIELRRFLLGRAGNQNEAVETLDFLETVVNQLNGRSTEAKGPAANVEPQAAPIAPPAGVKVKKGKRPGPKGPRNDPVEDAKVYKKWDDGFAKKDFRDYRECDKTYGYDPGTTGAAVARYRSRERRAK